MALNWFGLAIVVGHWPLGVIPWEQIRAFGPLGEALIKQLLWGLLKTGLATLVAILCWYLVNRLFAFLRDRLNALHSKYARTIRIGRKEVIRPEQVAQILNKTIAWSRFGVLAAILLLYGNAVLSFFPQTQALAASLSASLWASLSQVMLGFIGYVPKLIFLILLGIIAFYVLRFTQFLFQEVEDGEVAMPGFDPEWATPTARIVQIAAIAFFAVIAFPYLPGAGSEAFRGISIFIGILLSIGSSSAISNIIAGILLTYTRAFRLGDDIEVDGVMGTVIEKGFLVTRLRNYDNQFVSIPNSTVLSNKVVNFRTVAAPRDDLQPPPLLRVTLAIPHEVSPEMAQAVLLRAAWALPEVLREPAPFDQRVPPSGPGRTG